MGRAVLDPMVSRGDVMQGAADDEAGRPRLLMVMPYRQLVRKAKAEGFWVAALWDPSLESPEYLQDVREAADVFALTDFQDDAGFRSVIRKMTAEHDVSTIYHIGREESMIAAYEVAQELGAELNPVSAIRLLTDKRLMRAHLAEHGLSSVRFAEADNRTAVVRALDRIGFPAVVKPAALSGSRGVFLIRNAADQAGWSVAMDESRYSGPFLVEEYLSGPEFSIETLSQGGHHTVIGVTAKQVGAHPLFVEVGHVHPAPLPPQRRAALSELTTRFLSVCGYRFGPAHTEAIWTEDGPRIVESQARLGGDRIPRLIELSSGLDIEQAIFAALAGRMPPVPNPTATALIRFLTFPPGAVAAVEGLEAARQITGVDDLQLKLEPGALAPPVRDSWSRHGHVIVSGDSPEHAQAVADQVIATLTVVVDQVATRGDGTRATSAAVG
jgi:biotin carboxylase